MLVQWTTLVRAQEREYLDNSEREAEVVDKKRLGLNVEYVEVLEKLGTLK